MSRADYAHWNEDADYMWWNEEGKHSESDSESCREDEYSAADAFAEELAEYSDDELRDALVYHTDEPNQLSLIRWEINYRGLKGDANG